MIQEEIRPGTLVLDGRYEVIACVGIGGSASVYRSREANGQEVALKVLLAARARNLYEVKRLEHEFNFGRALRYIDGITPALDHGTLPELDQRPYIAFPFLEGEELDYKLTSGPLSPQHASSVLVQLARVVAKVHEAGVLHRDIKPSNIMLGHDDTVSLLDFGHARRIGEQQPPPSSSNLTRAHELPGTRHYMAPEQILGGLPSTSWDVYAMGMTLYEALVGDCAYSDLSARESIQRRSKPDAKPIAIRWRRPGLPGPLADFVDRCLAYAPEDRPLTAAAFADELETVAPLKDEDEAPSRPKSTKATQRPRSGMQLGHYSVISQIGRGGCATVYSAHDTRNDTTIALKVLIERYKGRPEREALFEQEAKALRRIGPHPNIVELIEHGRLPGLDWPYLALKQVQGGSVADLIADTPVSARRVTDIAMQVALALRECHRAGVIHRDITPSNVLVDDEGRRVVLIDFSHSAWSDSPRVPRGHPDRRTRHGEVAGASQAMSPEQARAEPATHAMDIYAFGVLVFQMLTARAPFPEYIDRDIFIALQSRNHLDAPLLASSKFPDAPARLIDLVNACIQPDASERPPLSSVIRTLEESLASMAMPIPAMTEVFETPDSILAEASAPADTPASPPKHRPSRTLPYAVLGVAGLLLVVALVKLMMPTNVQPTPVLNPGPPSRAPTQAALISPAATTEPPPASPLAAPAKLDPPARLKTPPELPPSAARTILPEHPSTPSVRPPDPVEAPKTGCSGRSKQARAATKRQDWSGVLRATKNASCWSDQQERRKLRLEALRNAGKYTACVELATKVGDHRTAKFCNKRISPSP